MPAPFYHAIKGTTAGTPGTGAFTPNAASSGFRAWSNVPSGWIGLVRFEDGSAWELSYCYWNGTTLSRGTNQRVDSSTGAPLNLTSAATAALVVDASEVMSHLGGTPWVGSFAQINTSISNWRGGTTAETGTASAQNLGTSSVTAEHPRRQYASATTANAQAGWSNASGIGWGTVNTTAGRGGFELATRFGIVGLPTGPRFFNGATSVTYLANTAEPSALVSHIVGFAKDSTDTNIQFLTNSNASGGTKIDTGIALAAGGMYETTVWMEPGGGRAFGLLIRLDTGNIWYGSTTVDIPNAAVVMRAECLVGLSATTGTAATIAMSSMMMRGGT